MPVSACVASRAKRSLDKKPGHLASVSQAGHSLRFIVARSKRSIISYNPAFCDSWVKFYNPFVAQKRSIATIKIVRVNLRFKTNQGILSRLECRQFIVSALLETLC